MLGSSVRKLTIRMAQNEYFPGLESVAATLDSIETLSILNIDNGPLISRAVFATPKLRLQYLKLSMPILGKSPSERVRLIAKNSSAISDAIFAIATNSGALQAIDFLYERVDRSALQLLAAANPLLENTVFSLVESTLDYVVDIIESFSVCPKLKSMHVKFSVRPRLSQKVAAIANACVGIRLRSISVTVEKVRYV